MEIVREIRLTDQDRVALKRAFDIVNQINANSLTQKNETLHKELDKIPTVKAITVERLKDFRNEVMNMNSIAIIQRLDKLIERGGRMTCKEKIDEIEEMLNDPFVTNIECIERIREIVDEAEDKTIRLDKVKQARKEIGNLIPWDDGLVEMHEVLSVLDKLIEEVDQ